MEKDTFRWWDGVDGQLFEKFKTKVVVTSDAAGKRTFIGPEDPDAVATEKADVRTVGLCVILL